MTQDLFFKYVTLKVHKTCANLGYHCESDCKNNIIKVFSTLNYDGKPILTASLLDSVNSVTGVTFTSVSVDSDGRLYALFFIDLNSNGNTD